MLVNIFDGVWNNGYLMSGGRNLIVGSSNGDIRQWKEYGWLGKLYQYSEETHAYKITAVHGWHCCYYTDLIDYIGKKVTASMQAKLISAETTSTNTNSSFMLSNNFIVGGYHDIEATIYKPQQDTWLTISKTFVLNETGQFGIGVQCQPENAGSQTAWLIKDLKLELGTVATDWTPAPEDTFSEGTLHPNSIFTNYIPVKKNTQYVYGLSTENQLPAHKIRYFNSDGTYLKEVELSNASQNGLKTITFDDDYLIQLTFPDGLTDENKKNFKFKEENNMAIKAGNQITLVDITDAYSVMLTSEAYTFVGGTGGVGANQSCTTEAVAFCGNNQCSVVTVDAKSIVCPTGISAAVSNSGTSKVTIKFTTTATVNAACEATIPVSVDGITINKKFSFAVARTGNTGATGKGIKGTPVTEYVASTGNTTPPTSGWSTSIPSVAQGQYLWTRVTTTYTDNTTSVSYSVAKQGSTGATGTTGSQWYAGTGITGTSTTATAFADSGVANARVNDMYLNTSTGNTYKCTVAGNATNAKWVYAGNIKGVQGDKGNTGATGNGISKADITYASSSSNTSAPTSGWQNTPPSVSPGQYLWTKTVFTYTNGGTATQYSVAKQGNTGAAGADAITVSITSSNGTVFKNNSGSTVLTAHVYKGAVEQTVADNGTVSGLGTIKWYKVGSDTAVATAKTLTVSANDVDNTQAYTCQLEG